MKTKGIAREPIATWWRIGRYKIGISPVSVVAFTGSFVTLLRESRGLSSGHMVEMRERRDDIFPSFEQAKEEAVRRAESSVSIARDDLQMARSKLRQWQSVKDPQPPSAESHVCEYQPLTGDTEKRCFTCQRLM